MTDRRFRMMGSALIAGGGAIGSDSDVGALIALVFCILFLVDWIPPLLKEYGGTTPAEESAKTDAEAKSEPEASLKD